MKNPSDLKDENGFLFIEPKTTKVLSFNETLTVTKRKRGMGLPNSGFKRMEIHLHSHKLSAKK
ncbi:hypothetical protein HAX54_041448, partial [Datura stramonium]|nr:hypothetical protein [Datura stramonium]